MSELVVKLQDILQYLDSNVLLMDGAMGTYIYSKGIFIDKCYDELNLLNPELIQTIHQEYLNAGSKLIETNTFGANRIKLKKHSLHDQIKEINFNGAQLAKEAAQNNAYVAGSMGPLGVEIEPYGELSLQEVVDIYQEQAANLEAGGVDLFLLETFRNLDTLKAAVQGVRNASDLPIAALMTFNPDGLTAYGNDVTSVAMSLSELDINILGMNCTLGPKSMLDFLEQMINQTQLPIAIVPNAGLPQYIDGRTFYMSTPDYFQVYGKRFIEAGARLIGGCCGTTPEHIEKMSAALAQKQTRIQSGIKINAKKENPAVDPVPIEKKSHLANKLHQGEFVTMIEMVSPRGVDAKKQLLGAELLKKKGIDAINIPDGPRASSRMNGLALALLLQNQVEIEAILHYTCRDRNILGMQSDLLGASALGIKNILAITGDPPMMGEYPQATAVFDVDAIGLTHLIHQLNHGLDLGGKPIGKPTSYLIGVGVDPNSINLEKELDRYRQKIDAGAEYAISQPVFDIEAFYRFFERTKETSIFVIAGVWPLVSLRNAEFMKNEVPGVTVPDSIMNRMAKFESKEDQLKMGIEIAQEMIFDIKNAVNGLQVSAPFGRYQLSIDILSNIL